MAQAQQGWQSALDAIPDDGKAPPQVPLPSGWQSQLDAIPDSAAAPQDTPSGGSPPPMHMLRVIGNEAAKGGIALAGVPGDINQLTNSGLNWLGLPSAALPFPTSESMTSGARKQNLVDAPGSAPVNMKERFAGAFANAAPATLATMLSGGATIPSLVAGGLSAAASQGYKEFDPNSKWGPLLVGTAAGLGVTSASALGTAASKYKAAVGLVTAAEQKLKAATQAAFYGGNELASGVAKTVTESKDYFNKIKSALLGAQDEHAQAVDKLVQQVASTAGKSSTYQEAGQALQSQARTWINSTFPKRMKEIWAPLEAKVPGETPMTLDNFSAALHDINGNAGALEPVARLFKPALPAQVGARLKDILDDTGTTQLGQQITWKDVRALRTTLGSALADPKVIRDVGQQNLNHLYQALTSDLSQAARSAGAGAEFYAANVASQRLYDFAEGPLSRVIGGKTASLADDPKPEAVAKGLLTSGKAGATDLAALRDQIPGAVDELTAAHLRMNPGGWRALAPEAKEALLPDQGALSLLDSSLGEKDFIKRTTGEAVAWAQAQHASGVDAARGAASSAKFGLRARKFEAQNALTEAKAKVPQQITVLHHGANAAGNLLGMGLASELGTLALHSLPGSDWTHAATGALLGGAIIPAFSASGQAIARDPGSLRYLAEGGLVGHGLGYNALTGQEGQ